MKGITREPMADYMDLNIQIRDCLVRIRSGTTEDIHRSLMAETIDCPSRKTIERRLRGLSRLGIVSASAELRQGQPKKTWKVIICPCGA